MAPSRFAQIANAINKLPSPLRNRTLTAAVGRVIRFAGHAGIEVLQLEPGTVHLRLKNKRQVRNHIGGVHAAAMALLAESASGYVLGLSLPAGKTPVIKSMEVNYRRRAQGALEAVATLNQEERHLIESQDSGELTVRVQVTDERGDAPIECRMLWAWRPDRKTTT